LTELLLNGLSRSEARRLASQYADQKVRGEIRKLPTVFDYLSTRNVSVLEDTGALVNSLSPGVEGVQSNAEGQVFRVETGAVIVGTREEEKWRHHYGIPSRNVPARPFWRPDQSLPDEWADFILDAMVKRLDWWLQRLVSGNALRRGA
jgi:hypothetical protein